MWDSTQPPASSCTSRVHAHAGEVLTCDWSKYDPNILFTGGVDRTLRSWDLRRLSLPLATLEGHTQAVRRVRCDPFAGDRVASCSYDFSVRWWDISRPAGQQLTQTLTHHSEFTFGLDLCSLEAGKVGRFIILAHGHIWQWSLHFFFSFFVTRAFQVWGCS